MQMQHNEAKEVRLERVAHLLMCEVDEAIEASSGTSMWPVVMLKQLKQRVEELQAVIKL
jgi:hypothetical protein